MTDQSDVESHYSYAGSHQNFIVEDPEKPHRDETTYGLNPSKLSWVTDIFGDTSVLKPLGEIDGGDEQPVDASVHASLGAAEAAAAASLAEQGAKVEMKDESEGLALPLADALDPDVLEKSYQLPSDHAFARSQHPERWLQKFGIPEDDVRKSDEEYQNEGAWMYTEIFRTRGYEKVDEW